MPKYLLLALNGPKPDVDEAEYNRWYDNQVIKIAGIPHVQSTRRFKVIGLKGVDQPYMAAYEIETDDIDAFLRDMNTRLQPINPPFDSSVSTSILAVQMD